MEGEVRNFKYETEKKGGGNPRISKGKEKKEPFRSEGNLNLIAYLGGETGRASSSTKLLS